MRQSFTISDIKNTACAHLNPHLTEDAKTGATAKKTDPKKSVAIRWLNKNLWLYCRENELELKKEFEFAEGRKFKSDYAIESEKLLIEYEGGVFMARAGHNSPTGIERDIAKYKLAHELGFTVLRFTALSYKNVLQELDKILKGK